MQEKNKQKNNTYFAAANGYDGFVSYFGDIFTPEKFERIFILKGGPGTGKSSLMKSIHRALCDEVDSDEIFLCSSDPYSLDGIILSRCGRRVAVIDGTSPHAREAYFPGAVDEICNLGEFWDEKWLVASREKIIKISKAKSDAYSAAYSYLSIAGKANSYIADIILSRFDYTAAKRAIKNIISEKSERDFGKRKTRLISSFGRFGEYKINSFSDGYDALCIGGERCAAQHFLTLLSREFTQEGLSNVTCPSPLSRELTDAIYLPDGKLFSVFGSTSELDTSSFLYPTTEYENEKLKRAREIHSIALTEAERFFDIAANMHRELEEVYTAAMNFAENDRFSETMIKKVKNIIEI